MVSESLRLLTKNEQMSESLIFLSQLLICSFLGKKTSDSLGKPMSKFPALKIYQLIAFLNSAYSFLRSFQKYITSLVVDLVFGES